MSGIYRIYTVGDGVEMRFNNGVITLYSDGGTLWSDWLERTTVRKNEIKSIRATDTVYLPEDAQGFDRQKKAYTMFGGLINVESIDLKGTDTSRVKKMAGMFCDCRNLKELDISGFDTSHVTNMSWMFLGCRALTGLNLSSFDTSNVTDMSSMFYNCRSLTNLDLSGFDISKIKCMTGMFDGCRNLKRIVMNLAVNPYVNTRAMFSNCRKDLILTDRTTEP